MITRSKKKRVQGPETDQGQDRGSPDQEQEFQDPRQAVLSRDEESPVEQESMMTVATPSLDQNDTSVDSSDKPGIETVIENETGIDARAVFRHQYPVSSNQINYIN